MKANENKRIRKEIIDFFRKQKIFLQKTSAFVKNNPKYRFVMDAIAYLEKQDEHLENFDEAEKEKSDFVGDGFIKCLANFLDFKEGETYWLEYIGDDKYNVRSDNLLSKTYHITPCQLYTVFKKLTWLEKQGDYNRLVEEIKECKELLSKEKKKATSANDKLSLGGRIAMLEELLTFNICNTTNKVEPKFHEGEWVTIKE